MTHATWPLQVLLPASVGASLLQQDAMVAGTPFFELRTASGARTHVGVLDYSAAEGTVALPLQVIRSLWGPDATLDAATGLLHVKFVRLNKGVQYVGSTVSCMGTCAAMSWRRLVGSAHTCSLQWPCVCIIQSWPSTPSRRCTAQGRM